MWRGLTGGEIKKRGKISEAGTSMIRSGGLDFRVCIFGLNSIGTNLRK